MLKHGVDSNPTKVTRFHDILRIVIFCVELYILRLWVGELLMIEYGYKRMQLKSTT